MADSIDELPLRRLRRTILDPVLHRTGTSVDTEEKEPVQRKKTIITTVHPGAREIVAEMAGHYSNWSTKYLRESYKSSWTSYAELLTLVQDWRSKKLHLIEATSSMLSAAAKLGGPGFYSEGKRFGANDEKGDTLYVDLNAKTIRDHLSGLVTSLQALRGEGAVKRKIVTPSDNASAEQSENDAMLKIANKLNEISAALLDPIFLDVHVKSRAEFEADSGLKWVTPTA